MNGPSKRMPMHGLLLFNKPVGVSSFDIIRKTKALLKKKYQLKSRQLPKIGHGGTLDPFADGLLVILIGQAVKLASYIQGSNKTYIANMKFGGRTISGDPENEVCEQTESIPDSLEDIQTAAKHFETSIYLQTPPMFSAKKLNNVPLYKLARKGKEVERKAVECSIQKLDILNYEKPNCQFKTLCSAGTYIRTLAEDLAKQCDSLAYLTTLRRTTSGQFKIENSLNETELEESLENEMLFTSQAWIPFDNSLDQYPNIEITKDTSDFLMHGKQHLIKNWLESLPELDTQFIIAKHNKALVAILEKDALKSFNLRRVFHPVQ